MIICFRIGTVFSPVKEPVLKLEDREQAFTSFNHTLKLDV
jgi:hypothetical protein